MTLPTDDLIVRELTAAVAGRYSLERELGRGGMGAVFLARDIKLDRLVAIKVLPPELAVRPELRERFLRETRTAASFSHPNIVSVHGVEETGNLLFFRRLRPQADGRNGRHAALHQPGAGVG